MNKKAQVDIKEMGITLVTVAILFIIGLLIFASISNTTDKIIDPTRVGVVNESITINMLGVPLSDNSTLLAEVGVITDSIIGRNGTGPNFDLMTLNTDYEVTITSTTGTLFNRANFTVINPSWNNTALFVSYDRNIQSVAQASIAVVETTVLDSFELGVIALIVLAAVVILGVLFTLGSQ